MARTTVSVRLGDDGSLDIPAEMREALGLRGGGMVTLELQDRSLTMISRAEAIRQVQERVRSLRGFDPSRSMADELIAERRAEAPRG